MLAAEYQEPNLVFDQKSLYPFSSFRWKSSPIDES